ncbi:MAG: hypothetical protein JWQ87_2038 [Candidatus Sulfotelmatobacter sp.]|nr:hypothetical protein [Candidatus Sulfotelmatobacter sp.]
MSRNRVWVELQGGKIARIFRSQGAAAKSQAAEEDRIREYPRKDATEAIRRQVYERANGECENCGKRLTWGTLHMNERIPRSKGGEVSVENGQALCYACHEGRLDSVHGNRLPRFGE